MTCSHELKQKDWLPSDNEILKLHPYCSKCGSVKNISSMGAVSAGFFANILARMKADFDKKGYRISQTQIRLVMKELEAREAFDKFSLSFEAQKMIFIDVVSKYIKISRWKIEEYL